MKQQFLDTQNVDLLAEIMHEILARIPVKPLCHFKCVSKPWRSLISDSVFVAKYFKAVENKDVFFQRRRLLFTIIDGRHHWLYSLDVDQFLNENDHNVDVAGLVATPTELDFVYNHLPKGGRDWSPFVHYSCYGLFLSQYLTGDCSYSLINPVTKESKTLPEPPLWRLPMKPLLYSMSVYGLGFDHSTNVYKVVNRQNYRDGIVFSVCTLQTDSWRQIDYLFPYYLPFDDAIVLNGAIHWLVKKVADRSLVIISFLLAEEEAEDRCNEFWVMKELGVRKSWTTMKVSRPYQVLSHSGFWTDSHDLMVSDQSSLVMCNFNDGTFWNLSLSIGDDSDDCYFGSIGIYVESLPSLTAQEQSRRNKEEPMILAPVKFLVDSAGDSTSMCLVMHEDQLQLLLTLPPMPMNASASHINSSSSGSTAIDLAYDVAVQSNGDIVQVQCT